MSIIANGLAWGVGVMAGMQLGMRAGVYWRPHPMPHQFASVLDHPVRYRYRNAGETVGLYGLMSGMSVLDIGCGTGTFTVEMARMVGSLGTVYAVDLQEPLLVAARARIASAGFEQRVQFRLAGAYGLPLADSSIDVAIMIAVLAEIPDRSRALAEIWRVLKPEGRLAISEELPDPAYAPPTVVRTWAEDAGFRFGGKGGSPFCYHHIYFKK